MTQDWAFKWRENNKNTQKLYKEFNFAILIVGRTRRQECFSHTNRNE